MASNDVIVRLIADMSNLQAGMQKAEKEITNLKGTTEKASSSIGNAFKKVGSVVVTAFAIDKLLEFGKHMVEVTATVQALDSQFQQTFKGDQQKAMAGISSQAKEQGIHVDRLRGQWASFYGTFRGNGADANKSLELTQKYMHLAGDASAYYDKSLEDVSGRLKSIIMGNFEAGDAIGLNLNVTKLDTIAKKKYSKSWQQLNDTQKEFLILDTAEQIYKNSGAVGQGARESQNWENVTGNLKATWERLLSVLGSPILQIATSGVLSLTDSIQAVSDKVQQFADLYSKAYENGGGLFGSISTALNEMGFEKLADLVTWIGDVCTGAKDFVDWFSQMDTGATLLAGVLGTLGTLLIAFNLYLKSGAISSGLMSTALSIQTGITTALNVVTGVFGALMSFILSPIGLIIIAIGVLVTAGVLLYKNWDTICEYASKLGEWISEVWNSICEWTSETWNSICEYVSEAWNGICDGVSEGLEAVKNFFVTGWNNICDTCSAVWEFIKNIVTLGIMAVASVVEALINLVTLPIMFVWENTKEYIFQAWEYIKNIVSNGITAVYDIAVALFTPVAEFFSTAWEGLKNGCSVIWESIKNFFIDWFNWYKGIITSVFTAVSDFFTNLWNGIKSVCSNVWEGIKNFFIAWFEWYKSIVLSIFNKIKEVISNIWNGIKSVTSSVWNSIKSICSSVWNGIKSVISSAINSVKSVVSSVWNSIKSTTSSVWEGIKNAMWKPIEWAKNKIHDLVEAVKNFFKFKISFPKPKMPHFSITGEFSLKKMTVPHLSVDWYATGGIATAPSIVGIGEAGDEAILPLSNKGRMKPFAKAVAEMMPDAVEGDSTNNSKGINIQIGSLVVREEADIKKIAEELYKLQEKNRRARGKVW